MPIKFACPSCGKRISAPDQAAGKVGKCSGCGAKLRIPKRSHQSGQPTAIQSSPRTSRSAREPDDFDFADESSPYDTPPRRDSAKPTSTANPASHSLGIASLVLGVVAIVMCWMPLINGLVAGTGFLLGVIGLFLAISRKGTGIGYSIAGLCTNGIAGAAAIVMFLVFGAAFGTTAAAVDAVAEAARDARAQRKEKQAEQAAAEADAWEVAGTTVSSNETTVTISSISLGVVAMDMLGRQTETNDPYITVWFDVANNSETTLLKYTSPLRYIEFGAPSTTLTDTFGNTYDRLNLSPSQRITEAAGSTEIRPGQSARDAVVFTLPVDAADELRMELTKSCVNSDQPLRFKFRISDFTDRQPSAGETASDE